MDRASAIQVMLVPAVLSATPITMGTLIALSARGHKRVMEMETARPTTTEPVFVMSASPATIALLAAAITIHTLNVHIAHVELIAVEMANA